MRDVCLAILFFYKKHGNEESQTVKKIREKLYLARISPKKLINISDVLSKSMPYAHIVGKEGNENLWSTTDSGDEYISNLLNLSSIDSETLYDITTLDSLVRTVTDLEISQYLEEALKCLKVGALRATVVFVWTGVARHIQQKLIAFENGLLNSAIQKHDPKSRLVKTVEDFAYIKEKVLLLTSQDLGIYDKNQRGVLEDALELRNKCGHPGNYNPGPKKVSSFLEDVIGIVFV